MSIPKLSFRDWMNSMCSAGLTTVISDLGELITIHDPENRYFVLKEMRTGISGLAAQVSQHRPPARFRSEFKTQVVVPLITLARESRSFPESFRRHRMSIKQIAKEVIHGFRPMVRFGSRHRLNDCPGSLPPISA